MSWKRLPKILRSIGENSWADENRSNEFGFIFLLIFKNFLEESLRYLNYLSYFKKYLHISKS